MPILTLKQSDLLAFPPAEEFKYLPCQTPSHEQKISTLADTSRDFRIQGRQTVSRDFLPEPVALNDLMTQLDVLCDGNIALMDDLICYGNQIINSFIFQIVAAVTVKINLSKKVSLNSPIPADAQTKLTNFSKGPRYHEVILDTEMDIINFCSREDQGPPFYRNEYDQIRQYSGENNEQPLPILNLKVQVNWWVCGDQVHRCINFIQLEPKTTQISLDKYHLFRYIPFKTTLKRVFTTQVFKENCILALYREQSFALNSLHQSLVKQYQLYKLFCERKYLALQNELDAKNPLLSSALPSLIELSNNEESIQQAFDEQLKHHLNSLAEISSKLNFTHLSRATENTLVALTRTIDDYKTYLDNTYLMLKSNFTTKKKYVYILNKVENLDEKICYYAMIYYFKKFILPLNSSELAILLRPNINAQLLCFSPRLHIYLHSLKNCSDRLKNNILYACAQIALRQFPPTFNPINLLTGSQTTSYGSKYFGFFQPREMSRHSFEMAKYSVLFQTYLFDTIVLSLYLAIKEHQLFYQLKESSQLTYVKLLSSLEQFILKNDLSFPIYDTPKSRALRAAYTLSKSKYHSFLKHEPNPLLQFLFIKQKQCEIDYANTVILKLRRPNLYKVLNESLLAKEENVLARYPTMIY